MIGQRKDRTADAVDHLVQQLLSGTLASRDQLAKAKKEAARIFSLDRYISNSEIISSLPADGRRSFVEMLLVHPRRSASGIVVVTAFTSPFACPHGTCVFCPGGPTAGTPQSYMRDSPGMRSALAAAFDPYGQVRKSLEKYIANGHDPSKVETIVEGGTFIAAPPDYQRDFVKGVYDGLNGFRAATLSDAQAANETARSRCVGLTLESKPDWCRPQDIDLMLSYGITRLEIGVQSLRDPILLRNNRGHSTEDSAAAFQVARDAGLKVTAHMMPGLPGGDPETDLGDMRRLFEDESFKPDMMKVYPTLVVVGTSLERQYHAGRYEPLTLEAAVELLSDMKRFVPRWHRIMRIQREIPAHEIVAGVKNGNLRELVLQRAREKGHPCECIRCREVAMSDPSTLEENDELEFKSESYVASGGEELFGSYEYAKTGRIAGFVRLRHPSPRAHRPETKDSCIVRELRVYGRVVALGEKKRNAWQHRGLGRSLMARAEKIAVEEFDAKKLLVTSAVGTRNYYRRLGYERSGPYMAKNLVR